MDIGQLWGIIAGSRETRARRMTGMVRREGKTMESPGEQRPGESFSRESFESSPKLLSARGFQARWRIPFDAALIRSNVERAWQAREKLGISKKMSPCQINSTRFISVAS